MDIKVEVQTEYERFIITIPNVPENLTPGQLAGQTVENVLTAVADGKTVFQGADAREGQLIFINGGPTAVKHVVLLGAVPQAPAVEDASPEGWEEGPHSFVMTSNFASQTVVIKGLAYNYLNPTNQGSPQECVYVPISVNDRPALDALGLENLRNLMFNYLKDRTEPHVILIPPGVITWEQAVEYAADWVTEELHNTPYVAKEKTAKAWYGHSRSGIAEE